MAGRKTRRRVVSLLGAAASAGLAGCFTVTQSETAGSSSDPTPTETGTDGATTPTPEGTPAPTEEAVTPAAERRPAIDSHLAPADNYDGTIVDARGQSRVTVSVAVEANGGAFGFGPPAVHVDNGTTVQWEWTGDGGGHTVESTGEGPLDSGQAVGASGVNYSFTFESDGIYNYVCLPHEGQGMKGSVIVGDDYPTAE